MVPRTWINFYDSNKEERNYESRLQPRQHVTRFVLSEGRVETFQ